MPHARARPRARPATEALRARIRRIEAGGRPARGVLPFGLEALDRALPRGGLALGALHEVAGGAGATCGAAAALFAAGVAARRPGPVLWCVSEPDLFAPALSQAGLDPDRVIVLEAGDEASGLACVEEGLRHGGLGSVVAEVARLPLTTSRRLQLAAEASGTLGLAVRRWRRPGEAVGLGHPTAAATRWRVTALPSALAPVPGLGRARWRVELVRCRGGGAADLVVESCWGGQPFMTLVTDPDYESSTNVHSVEEPTKKRNTSHAV